jgi:ribosomal protein S27AE
MYEPDDDEIDETLAECPKCGASVYDDIEKCPHCGDWIGTPEFAAGRGKRVFVVIVALILLSLTLWWLFR